MIGGQGGQGGQRLRLADNVKPCPDASAGPLLPAFEGGQDVHVPEQYQSQRDVEEGRPPGFGHVQQPAQRRDLSRGGSRAGAQPLSEVRRVA